MSVPKIWDLPFEIRARVSEHSGRQRAITSDGHLMIVMHKVPEARTTRRESVYLWRNRKSEWKFSERGAGLSGLNNVAEGYEEVVQQLEKMQDDANSPEGWYAVVEQAAPLLRASRNLYDALIEARAILESPDDPTTSESPEDRAIFQPACDRINGVFRAAELLHQDAKNAIDFSIAKQAQVQAVVNREQARAAHRLNVLAAIFLPLGTIASVFGMNLHSGLESSQIWLFWLVLFFGVGLGVGIGGYVLNFKGDTLVE
jgi:Mg2+ and Co2+ transporter CorA